MRRLITCGAILGMTALTACGGSAGGDLGVQKPVSEVLPAATAENNVNATVADFQITFDKASATAGVVAVHVSGKGPSQHELVAFKTELAPDALPINEKESKVDEGNPAVQHFSPEAEKIDAGGQKSINLNLPAGNYVFICNVPGHYRLGMHTAFAVR